MSEGVPNVAEELVGEDLACAGCGYNLRTMPVGGKCPECGMWVATTLRIANGSGAVDLRRIFWGAVCVALMPVVSMIELFAIVRLEKTWVDWAFLRATMWGAGGAMRCGLLVAALMLFTHGWGQSRAASLGRVICLARAFAEGVGMLAAIAGAYLFFPEFGPHGAGRGATIWISQVIDSTEAMCGFLGIGVCYIAWRFLSELGARLKLRWFRWISMPALLLMAVADFYRAAFGVDSVRAHLVQNYEPLGLVRFLNEWIDGADVRGDFVQFYLGVFIATVAIVLRRRAAGARVAEGHGRLKAGLRTW